MSGAKAFPCLVVGCDRGFDTRQGRATHMSRSHPEIDRSGLDPAIDHAEGQVAEHTITCSVVFDDDELVLLQALAFLRGGDVNDLAVEAFNDLLTWARAQEAVCTLVALRDEWAGALVHLDECGPACSEAHTYVAGECAQAMPALAVVPDEDETGVEA